MKIDVTHVSVEEILPLRELHRAEMRCQIVHDSLHERGLSRSYRLRLDGAVVGYGSVFGLGDEPKDTVDEFFVRVEHRGAAQFLFRGLVEASGAKKIQAQTNDALLSLMLFDFAGEVRRDRILFEDGFTSRLEASDVTFRRVGEEHASRRIGGRPLGQAGEWFLDRDEEVVAAGGVLFHYNPPYGDVYMEVAEPHRRRGYGSFLVQELKRVCYEMGKTPAARCQAGNVPSRRTLQRAGMLPCGSILVGVIAT